MNDPILTTSYVCGDIPSNPPGTPLPGYSESQHRQLNGIKPPMWINHAGEWQA